MLARSGPCGLDVGTLIRLLVIRKTQIERRRAQKTFCDFFKANNGPIYDFNVCCFGPVRVTFTSGFFGLPSDFFCITQKQLIVFHISYLFYQWVVIAIICEVYLISR